jgi:hypothetical protein
VCDIGSGDSAELSPMFGWFCDYAQAFIIWLMLIVRVENFQMEYCCANLMLSCSMFINLLR